MSKADELAKLFELKKNGILTEEEFNREKQKILGHEPASQPSESGQTVSLPNTPLVPGTIETASNFVSSEMFQMSCPKCKGEVQFLPGLDVLQCSFCGNEMPVDNKKTSTVEIPNKLIPFAMPEETAGKAFYQLLAEHDLVPDDIFEGDKIRVFGMYRPVYIFTGKYEANWTAVTIIEYNHGNQGKSQQGNPVSGTVKGRFTVGINASKMIEPLANYTDADSLLKWAVPYKPAYFQGYQVESLSSANNQQDCEGELRRVVHGMAQSSAIGMIPTKDYINFNINVDITSESAAILLPDWICEVNYNGRVYKLWLPGGNGNDEKDVKGEFPIDQTRKTASESLKGEGTMYYVIAGLACCIGGGIAMWLDSEHIKFMSTVFFYVALGGSIYLAVKGYQKGKVGKTKADNILAQSKEKRRNCMPSKFKAPPRL